MILITIKVLNIGTDRSDPDQTAPNYAQSDQGLHCFVIPPASVYAFTAIKQEAHGPHRSPELTAVNMYM